MSTKTTAATDTAARPEPREPSPTAAVDGPSTTATVSEPSPGSSASAPEGQAGQGYWVHFTMAITVVVSPRAGGYAVVTQRGQDLFVTPEIEELNQDRYGWSIFTRGRAELVAQFGGRPPFELGKWPEGMQRHEWGSPLWQQEYDRAKTEASRISNPETKAARMADIDASFGPLPKTNRTTAVTRTSRRQVGSREFGPQPGPAGSARGGAGLADTHSDRPISERSAAVSGS